MVYIYALSLVGLRAFVFYSLKSPLKKGIVFEKGRANNILMMNQDKQKATLFFRSIIELIGFEQKVGLIGHQVDNISLSITGYFAEDELKTALKDYGGSLSGKGQVGKNAAQN